MEKILGLLRVRVLRGINLAVRDTRTSDPYVVVTLGQQRLKTRVVENSCNPVWNDELTLTVANPEERVILTVYDRDTFTADDKMGTADIDIGPLIDCVNMGVQNLPDGCAIKRIYPSSMNCLADESSIIWHNGKIIQNMLLRLRNVECGEVEIQLEWITPYSTVVSGKDM